MSEIQKISPVKKLFKKFANQWNEHEKKTFPERQKNFIIGIQVTHGLSKKEAIDYFGRMNTRSKEDFKALEKRVKTRLEHYSSSDSGGKKIQQIVTMSDFKKMQKNLQKNRNVNAVRKAEHKQKEQKATVKKLKLSDWLKSNLTKKVVTKKTLTRVQKAHKKYPDASKYELQHGVNSVASENYRLSHGKTKLYSGRVKNEK